MIPLEDNVAHIAATHVAPALGLPLPGDFRAACKARRNRLLTRAALFTEPQPYWRFGERGSGPARRRWRRAAALFAPR
jgi:hypothetical protein